MWGKEEEEERFRVGRRGSHVTLPDIIYSPRVCTASCQSSWLKGDTDLIRLTADYLQELSFICLTCTFFRGGPESVPDRVSMEIH
jgi:hypothetical protein